MSLGPLAGNPFPDATPEFFDGMATRFARAGSAVEIAAPFVALHKEDVVRSALELGVPLELTLSCMNPIWNDALRVVQQVPRAERRVSSGAGRRPTTYANISPR